MNSKLRKRYVETSRGLVHVQEAGNKGAPALVLITLTSFAAPLLDGVLPALAEHGWHALALDLMGYGRSDKRDGHWMVEDFADNMLVGGAIVLMLLALRPEPVAGEKMLQPATSAESLPVQ